MADPMQNERGGSAVNAMVDQEPAGGVSPVTPAQGTAEAPAARQPDTPQPQAAPAQAAASQPAPDGAPKANPAEESKPAAAPAGEPSASQAAAALFDTGRIQSIKVKVQAMLGGATLSVSQLSEIKQGDTVSLNSRIGDPVQILANGQLIGHGQLVVIESDPPSFGIRLESLVDNS